MMLLGTTIVSFALKVEYLSGPVIFVDPYCKIEVVKGHLFLGMGGRLEGAPSC
jgi:hypothetical protein